MVIGSIARGTANDASDVDVLVVKNDGCDSSFRRKVDGGVLVEIVSMPAGAWRTHLASARPRWIWALTDGGAILFDDGELGVLVAEAAQVLRTFRTPADVRAEVATNLWHARAKLERALLSDDAATMAYVAGLCLPDVLDGLLAIHNRPTVPGARRLEILQKVELEAPDAQALDAVWHGAPRARLEAVRSLADTVAARLGSPQLERLRW
jgi:hypothetical protein